MDDRVLSTLEYTKILTMLADQARSGLGRELALALRPLKNPNAVTPAILETTEAKKIIESGAQVPLWGLADVRPLVDRAHKGGMLQATDLVRVADCLRGCAELKRYMATKQVLAPRLSLYADGIVPLNSVAADIHASVDGSRVADRASPRLAKIRREMRVAEDRIKSKLQSILTAAQYRDVLQESLVTVRGDRYAIPVKASQRHRIKGEVIDSSGSGMTVFVEPASVRQATEELRILKAQEEAEEYQILSALSSLVAEQALTIETNLEIMGLYDLAFAKGRLSVEMSAQPVRVGSSACIQLLGARHPLIEGEVVPLDIVLGRRYRTLVITGPNTGGKTVSLKTVGLLALMAQSGLHITADEGSEIGVFDKVLLDIGDAQSIEQSLSTFSGHLRQITEIIAAATPASLVLIDEIGTGTDPAEGAALAMAILEELHGYGCLTLASTHYSDVKRLADTQSGFINGRMDFDRETLKPLYRLVIGEAGESQALWIAAQLGLGKRIVERAREHLHGNRSSLLADDSSASVTKPPEVAVRPTGPAGAQPGGSAASAATAGDGEVAAATRRTGVLAADAGGGKARRPWRLGDSVLLAEANNQQGVIVVLPDERGQLTVLSRRRRVTVHERRIRLLVGAEHLYPEGYDLRTVLFTWAERQAIHKLQRGGTQIVDSSSGNEWVKTDVVEVDRKQS